MKTDRSGKQLASVSVAKHHGALCLHDGKLFVAVNLGKFNDPQGNADSWVHVYDSDSLQETSRHVVPEVFHGAGGIGAVDGRFFGVGGLPDDVKQDFVYQCDGKFQFVKKHTIDSGSSIRLNIEGETRDKMTRVLCLL